jgi:hypothetical protein
MDDRALRRYKRTHVPAQILARILSVGGRNLFDEPMFRLVLAETRIRLAAGAWVIWPEDSNPEDRGGTNIKQVLDLISRKIKNSG